MVLRASPSNSFGFLNVPKIFHVRFVNILGAPKMQTKQDERAQMSYSELVAMKHFLLILFIY